MRDDKLIFLPWVDHEGSQTQNSASMEKAFLKFSKKELSKMPTWFVKVYKLKGGKVAHIRQKSNGTYEIRYRRDGLNISVGSKSLVDAKERFIQALRDARTNELKDTAIFGQFANQWLEVVKKPHIKESTYEDYIVNFRAHILPKFGSKRLRDIKPLDVQKLLNGIEQKGSPRSAIKVYTLLKSLFDFALAEDLITKNPMTIIQKPQHEAKHGQAFTVEEERNFIAKCIASSSPCKYAYILMLFTGIRRSELPSVQFDSTWVTVITAKTRKGLNVKTRKIPISPMLMPFMPFMTKENLTANNDTLSRHFPKLAPHHHLHELRHTFITRCQEMGISRELTSLWAGHRADNTITSNVYTHFSDEFQIGEIKKLSY